MRAVRTLLLTAVLSAVALATPNPVHAVAKDAAAHLADLANSLPSTKHSLHHPRNVKDIAHLFTAKQTTTTAAGTCDTAAFAEATSKVVQACPSLSGLVSGTTAPEEFLPTFCQSECYTVLGSEFAKNRGCIDGQTLFLVGMVNMCQTRPHCYTKAIVNEQVTFAKECEAGITAIGNVSSVTTVDLAVATCAGTCRTRLKDLYTTHPECMADPEGIPKLYAPVAQLLDFMCSEVGGSACTKSLRGVGRLNCQTSTCTNANYWCKVDGTSCNINPSSDNLKSLCNSCLDGLIAIADAPGSNARDAIKTVATKELLCGRVNPADASSNLCYLPAMASFGAAQYAITNASFTTATNDALCSGDNLKCVPRTLALSATMAQNAARDNFKKCIAITGRTVALCQAVLEADLVNAEYLRAMSTLVCEDNRQAAPYNLKCLTVALQVAGWASSACHSACAAGVSVSPCNSTADTIVATTGCCGALVNPLVAAMLPSMFQGNYLPSGTQTVAGKTLTFSAANANAGTVDRTKRPLYTVAQCQGYYEPNALWTTWESKCPARSTAVERSLKLFASWERVNAKTGLPRKLADALRSDMAVNLGVPINWISSYALTEDTTVKLNLRIKGSRRQVASGTGNGMKFTFSIDGAATADVTAAVGLFDTKLNAGAVYAPNGASVMEDECTDCSDAYSSSMVRPAVQQSTAAPGTFVTTLAAGSASSVSAAVVAVLAMVLAVVA